MYMYILKINIDKNKNKCCRHSISHKYNWIHINFIECSYTFPIIKFQYNIIYKN